MLCVLIALFALAPASSALAHPFPSVIHDYVVTLTADKLSVRSYLRISPELVPEVYRQIDTDNDGVTSEAERQAWIASHPSRLHASLDGADVELSMSQAPGLSREDLLLSIQEPLIVDYSYTPPAPLEGKHAINLTYGDNYLPYDEYYLSVAKEMTGDATPSNISQPQYPANRRIIYDIPSPGESSKLPEGQLAPAPVTSLAPGSQSQPQEIMGSDGSIEPVQPVKKDTGILGTLRDWRGEFGTALWMLATALFLGALHALTPGHGKAMVAAYLIGSRGRVRDAVLLGGVVTFTHTAGVVALGLALALISTFAMPRALTPALSLASGILVLGLGAYLLVTRWRNMPHKSLVTGHKPKVAPLPPASSPTTGEGEHSHAHEVKIPVAAGVASQAIPAAQALVPAGTRPLPAHSANLHSHNGHVHEHSHDHHDHHDHEHGHSHGAQDEMIKGFVSPDRGRTNLRALVALGVAGGLVPCPDALAILLLAVSLSQFTLGLGLVVSFSLGLALVLIGIGIGLVKMKGALERTRAASFTSNPLWTNWVPIASAAIVVAVGVVMVLSALGSRWG